MNLFFGSSSTAAGDGPENIIAALRHRFDTTTEASIGNHDGGPFCAALGDGGAVLGSARDGDLLLTYLGTFPNSLPGWPGPGSPLDDPATTAAWLLARFRQLDTAFLDGLAGQYSVAVCDAATGRLVLASDAGGNRRLFLHRGETLTFATKLAAFRDLLGSHLEVDRSLEDFLLGYEFLPWGRTVYRGIEILAPGTLLDFRSAKATSRAIAAPPEPAPVDFAGAGEDEVAEALYQGLAEAVADQAAGGERIAVLLGGFDSALVAALLQRLGKKVETFSFSFAEPGYDQPKVEELAALLGFRHHWVRITPEVLRHGLESFGRVFHQPASQPHYLIQTAFTCAAVRSEGILHCVTGDGCDGLFLGYPTVYRRARLITALSGLPRPLLNLGLAALQPAFLERRLGHPYHLARHVLTILKRPLPARGHIASRVFDELALSRLRLDPAPHQELGVEEILARLAEGLEGMDPVRLAYRGKGAVGLNKNKLEGSSDNAGITLQTPFAHPRLVALAAAIPNSLSRPDPAAGASAAATRTATGKYILMKMAEDRGLLPADVIHQAKRSPVHAPVDRWYQGPLRPFVFERLEGLPFRWSRPYVEGLLRPKLAESLYRRHLSLGDLALQTVALLTSYAALTDGVEAPPSPR